MFASLRCQPARALHGQFDDLNFQISDSLGKKIAVVLMDTQGVFDVNSTLEESKSLFSLSVLLSSVQIFNVKDNINADNLRHLEIFAEFSRVISGTEMHTRHNGEAFQELLFLVRDWPNPEQNSYGWEGGQKKLDE